jgi:DNA polymerase family A
LGGRRFCAAAEELRDFSAVDLDALDRSVLEQCPVRSPIAISLTILTDRLNAPVQGTAADSLKLALALLWKRRDECPGAVPVLVCHDEVVVECDADKAVEAKEWLVEAMKDGMDAVVNVMEPHIPIEVEASVSRTWSG